MTKTLTEQLKDGSFEYGVYYCQTKDDGILKLELCHEGDGHGYAYCYGEEECYRYEDIEEVLAPVPSYNHFSQLVKKVERLQKQLEIATKALKGVCVWANTGNGGEKAVKKVCEKALKEMEGVK